MKAKLFSFLLGTYISTLQGISAPSLADSLKMLDIPEVRVIGSRNSFFKDDKFITRFDSLQLIRNQNGTLSDLIMQNSPELIRSYGSLGSLSTVTLRGTSGAHTQVSWNGFPINSITSGDADLSLIGSCSANQVQLVHGGHGSINGSGTVGGAIELSNQVDWNRSIGIKLSTEMGLFDRSLSENPLMFKPGSLDSKRYTICAEGGNNNFQAYVSVFSQNANNEYPIKPAISSDFLNNQAHNQLLMRGTVQHYAYKINNYSSIEAGLWWQSKYYELPKYGGYGSDLDPVQRDSTLKTFVKLNLYRNKYSVSVSTGWFDDNLNYYSLNSKSNIGVQKWMNDVYLKSIVNENIAFDCGVSYYNIAGKYWFNENSTFTTLGRTEDWFMTYASFRYSRGRLVTNISVREDYFGAITPLQAALGVKFKILDEKLAIKGSASRRYRQPTFNEKYWPNLGKANLSPELGWAFDNGVEGIFKINKWVTSKYSAVIYSTIVKNWIQWVPIASSGTIWEPTNYKNVWARGIEASFEQSFSITGKVIAWNIKYNYSPTTTTDNKSATANGKEMQLMLVPTNSAFYSLGYTSRKADILLSANYRGKYYSTNDESSIPIPACTIYNFSLGYTLQYFNYNKFRIGMRISNLFDQKFQLLPDYPMPGRAYYFSLTYFFSKYNY